MKVSNVITINNLRKQAFTLAEVLITLGIIGIVAEMTVPSLMQSTQHQELVAAAKHEYSVLSQAYMEILGDNGGNFSGVCSSESDGFAERDCFRALFGTKMKFVKTCYSNAVHGNPPVFGNCWHSNGSWYWLDKETPSLGDDSGAISVDGTLLWFVLWNSDCNSTYSSTDFESRTDYCGFIGYDVNGFKPPNTNGKDIFFVGVFNDRLKPYGGMGSNADDCSTSSSGYNCLNYVMQGKTYY